MNIIVVPQAERELKKAPKDVLRDAFDLFEQLANGVRLSMPISRTLPSIAKG